MNPNESLLTFRRATRADVPDIVRLLSDDDLGQQRERCETPLPQVYYTAFEEIDQDIHNQLVVIEQNGAIIGTLQLTFLPSLSFQGGKRAQIESVRVDGRFRGQGIGQKLCQWAIEQARQAGCHTVQLTTNASRADAHRFYQRLGFVPSHVGMKLHLH